MSVDHIRYDLLVREALRGVVRRVVSDVAKQKSLPGEHHFYIAFETKAPGVRISPRLRAQYPDEMTIVLQHQFWDLAVTDVGIEVGLSFGGVPEKLFVPFDAIKGFFDPSVQFGLEFEVVTEKTEDTKPASAAATAPASLPAASPAASPEQTPAGDGVGQAGNDRVASGEAAADSVPEDPESPKPEGGAEVVRLDRFRKK